MLRSIITVFTLMWLALALGQNNKTFLLMEKTDGISGQTWFYAGIGNAIQKDKIKENWDKDKYITSAAYTANGWFITMANCPTYSRQSYNITSSWPRQWVREKYDEGYYITSVSKSDKQWFVVMSKVNGFTAQSYNSGSASALSDWYDEKRDEGYFLTTALYGDGKWYWVMTKGSDIKTQGYKWASEGNLSSTIQSIWDEGKRVHLAEYGGGEYFIPYGLLKSDSQPAQSYKTGTNGVSEWISQHWDKGQNLKYIGGGNPESAAVAARTASGRDSRSPSPQANNVVRQYRETVSQYYFNEVTEYSNGNRIVATYGPCSLCGGTQRCGICHGQGGIVTAGYGNWIPCTGCGQSGRCTFCVNTGGYALMNSHLYGPDGREIYVPSVGGGGYPSTTTTTTTTSSPSTRGNSRSGSGICSSCGGSGVSRTANSGGSLSSWVAYYNSDGSSCPYCSRRDGHYHDKCSSCNVPR